MTYTAPTVNYSTAIDGVYTSLTGVQSVSISRGRQRFQDPFPPTVCVVELIPATSYTTPLAIGQFLDVRDANNSSSPCYFVGRITDVTRTYDVPYNSGTGYAPGDRITITAAGPVGLIGSAQLDNLNVFANSDVIDNCDNIAALAGITNNSFQQSIGVRCSADVISGPSLDYMNQFLQTGQAFIDDVDNKRTNTLSGGLFVDVYENSGFSPGAFVYSDTGQTRYTQLEFQSSAQSTFNYVEVQPHGLASQVTKAVSGPYNSLVYNTYNATTSDALALSGYLYNLLSGQLAPVPFTIATDTKAAPSCMDVAKIAPRPDPVPVIGQIATITFRGTTVSAQIQGFNANFYVDRANVQVYFSPSLGVPFTLDSSTAGVLDQNRLGYP